MIPRRLWTVLAWWMLLVLVTVSAEETPPGLVTKDSEQDLIAEATNTNPGAQAQKREASLSNSYGEPLPPDVYGPPSDITSNIIPDQHLPAPVYGVPFQNNVPQDTPPGAYGPPSPIVLQSQGYEGPPPPAPPDTYGTPKNTYGPPKQTYGRPKPVYGPPNNVYGPPKSSYGPPKKTYGPPKQQNLPKPTYGAPFKPPKALYGAPKPVYRPPKLGYGPPKQLYGSPRPEYGAPEPSREPPNAIYGTSLLPDVASLPAPDLPAISLPQTLNVVNNVGSVDLGVNLPAPIYGTPFGNIPGDLKPNFAIPSDSYGPPGISLGPVAQNDELVVQENIGHYGPPQPDPNPRPPHPGIPAPPTPPHVHYDGWRPIPGVSLPISSHVEQNIGNQYAPPPPPPSNQGIHFQLENQALPHPRVPPQFSGAQITSGYSNVHHDALANIDLNAITGGDTNHIDQSKTVFEAHYTIPNVQEENLAFVHSAIPTAPEKPLQNYGVPDFGIPSGISNQLILPSAPEKPSVSYGSPAINLPVSGPSIPISFEKPKDSYGIPVSHNSHLPPIPLISEKPLDSYRAPVAGFSTGRHHGPKGLLPPSGIYGVPPGSQYGAPPKPLPSHLPIPYGSFSGGGHSMHTGGHTPRNPIKFREPVPEGLFQHVAQVTNIKDSHGIDHFKQGSLYLPPPIRDAKDIQQTGHHGSNSISFSIEPSNIYSLPQINDPVNFHKQQQHQPSNLYGSPIDSYSVPLLTVADNTASGSNTNSVTASLDGTILSNLSNLEAAAILKHCPYHEAIIKAAKSGEKISPELAARYVASLSSLGVSLTKSQQTLISPQNGFNTPVPGSESVSYSSQDLATASQSLVESVISSDKNTEKVKIQKSKSLKDDASTKNSKHSENLKKQILQTSEKIKSLSEKTNELQKKIESSSQNLSKMTGQLSQFDETVFPVTGNVGSYTVQIQGSNGKDSQPSIPHEHLLSQGLLQSILQAVEQPQIGQSIIKVQNDKTNFAQTSSIDLAGLDFGGIDLPDGYEPIDRTKLKINNNTQSATSQDQEVQASNKDIRQVLYSEIVHSHRGDIPKTECELRADNSVRHVVVVPPPSKESVEPIADIDENEVAIFFGDNTKQLETTEKSKTTEKSNEPVTEISVSTSISEAVAKQKDKYKSKVEYNKKFIRKAT